MWLSLTHLDTQEEPLGEGTFSTVYRCHDASSGARHAVKFTKSNEQTRRALEREVKIMRGLITKVAAQAPRLSIIKNCFRLILAQQAVFVCFLNPREARSKLWFYIDQLYSITSSLCRLSWSWQMKDWNAVANDPRTPKGCSVFCV